MIQTHGSKNQKKGILLRKSSSPQGTRAIVILDMRDDNVSSFLKESASFIGITLTDTVDRENIAGYDACISDGMGDIDLVNLMKQSIVPIVTRDHPLISSLKEFDPMKFEWNAFIAESLNSYLIFEKLIRYLENIRYAGDKRILLNNVGKTF